MGQGGQSLGSESRLNRSESLPDPREFPPAAGALLSAAAAADNAALQAAIGSALAAGDDSAIHAALRALPVLARAVRDALATAVDAGDGIGMRFFAIPLVIIVGARNPLTLPGAVLDVAALVSLLEQQGAVGATRNFGLGNALCDVQALEAQSASALWRAGRDPSERTVAESLQPAPIAVGPGREQVHLRFLVGAGVTPQHLPSFLESASNIGTWGMPLTRELAKQLAQSGLEVLPMPRPPQPLLKAAYAGRAAQLEAALHLFLSNNVRRFRMSVGDPEAVLSAHRLSGGAGELRLSLSSPFDESMLEGFCWPLHPLDEVADVAVVFDQALADCRVTAVTVHEDVLPDVLDRGLRFLPARHLPASSH